MPLKHENIDFWFDHQPEKNNFRAIENSINRSHLIICLITQNFLNKESIRTKEIPLIKIRQTENIPVVPLLFEKCLWTINSWLNSMTLYPTTKKPVAEYELDEQDNLLMDIVGELFLRLKN